MRVGEDAEFIRFSRWALYDFGTSYMHGIRIAAHCSMQKNVE
jgi:hypothetical protein